MRGGTIASDRRSRSPQKKAAEMKRRPASVNRRRRTSHDEGRQVTHAFKEFVAHGANVNCLALGHKSGCVLVTGGDDKKVNLWAVGKPNCILSLSGHTTPVECVRFGSSEELVCAGSQSGALKIWDLKASKILRTLTGHKANIKCIDFHPYGDFIGTGSLDTNIKLWDIRRKGCIFTYKGHALPVNSLKFSPDGQWIASAGEDCMVKLWDLRAGKMLTEFGSHRGPVSDVEFHPHEFLLASASHDKTVNFWDLEKFSLVSATDADTGPVRAITFHPEGDCLYAGSPDLLKVYGWEPARTFDTVAMGWGKIQDVAIAQNQLIGAGFHGAHVAMYVVDLKRVQPLSGGGGDGAPLEAPSPFKYGTTVRKSFIKDKKSTQASAERMKTQEESDTGGEDPPEQDFNAPQPEILNCNDYRQIFATQRELASRLIRRHSTVHTRPTDPSMPQVLKSPAAVGEPPHSRLCVSSSKPSTPEVLRRTSRNIAAPPREVLSRLDNDLGSNLIERRASLHEPTTAAISPHRDPTMSPLLGPPLAPLPYRARAVSESRRQESTNSSAAHSPHSDQESSMSRYQIRHSPSEPHMGPRQSSPLQHPPSDFSTRNTTSSDLTMNNLEASSRSYSKPDVTATPHSRPNFTSSSRPDLTAHTKSADQRQNLVRHNSLRSPPTQEISYLGTPKHQQQHPELGPSYSAKDPSSLLYSPYDKLQHTQTTPDYLASVTDKIAALPFDDFLPNKLAGLGGGGGSQMMGSELSEAEVFSSIMRGHSSMMAVLTSRTRALQVTHKLWQSKDLKTAVEHALNTSDQALLADLLPVLNSRPSIWNLDICTTLLPPITLLLQSKYDTYVESGCGALRLIMKNFAHIIKSNMAGPCHSVGVDISREERRNKCVEFFNHLMSLRAFLLKRQTVPGRQGHTFRELILLMQQFFE